MPDLSVYPPAMQELISALKQLPGIGSRTAERLALAMLKWPDERLKGFGALLNNLKARIKSCDVCGNYSEQDLCRFCRSASRHHNIVCVVEEASQIPIIERSGSFDGVYHVLGGRLVPLEGKGPETLRINELKKRLGSEEIREIILATSPDVEGEATASYIVSELQGSGVAFSRIAAGIPVGADMSYADSATIAMAITSRRPVSD